MLQRKREFFLFLFLFFCAIFTRFFLLKSTATFFWDQAYDLRQIQIIFNEKKVTLLGPISEGGDKIYSSLTYYMLLPFAVLGNFSTISTTYGTAVYGILTACLLVILIYRMNKKAALGAAMVFTIWFPLIETSRWAWNPHFLLFWIVLGLLFWRRGGKVSLFLAGLFFGLSIHAHYLAVFGTGIFLFIHVLQSVQNKKVMKYTSAVCGYFVAMLPFVLFDLTHPPGLFLTRFFIYQNAYMNPEAANFVWRMVENFWLVIKHYAVWNVTGVLLATYVVFLLLHDWKKSKRNLLYIIPWIGQIVGTSLIQGAYPHYFLAGLVFFVVYLFLPRKVSKVNSVAVSTCLLIVGSVFSIHPQITSQKYVPPMWQPSIEVVDEITNIMYTEIKEKNLSAVNLAVLGSTDPNRYGWKYRSLLEIKGVTIRSRLEYFTNDYLFVVSQDSVEQLRKDISPEIERFRNQKLVEVWNIQNSEWKVYLFSF